MSCAAFREPITPAPMTSTSTSASLNARGSTLEKSDVEALQGAQVERRDAPDDDDRRRTHVE
jgi:hypothetical protein